MSGALRCMPRPLPAAATPLRSPHLRMAAQYGTTVVVGDDTTYTFRDRSAEVVVALWPLLDGRSSLTEVADGAGVPWDEASAHLAVLAADDWVVDTGAVHRAGDTPAFLVSYRALCEFWKKDIFIHPFWQTLAAGHAPPGLVLGWLVEFHHYIAAANEHMPASVAACRHDDTIQLWLARHYAEEYDHSAMFLDGLVAAGLNRAAVVSALPLASTRALINYITEVARTDTIAYAAMHGIFQTPGSTEGWRDVERFFDRLLSHYPFGDAVLRAFRDHAALDAELGHDDLVFSRICERVSRFSDDQIGHVLTATRGLVEHFVLFFDGILDAYGTLGEPAFVPRRRPDMRSLVPTA